MSVTVRIGVGSIRWLNTEEAGHVLREEIAMVGWRKGGVRLMVIGIADKQIPATLNMVLTVLDT